MEVIMHREAEQGLARDRLIALILLEYHNIPSEDINSVLHVGIDQISNVRFQGTQFHRVQQTVADQGITLISNGKRNLSDHFFDSMKLPSRVKLARVDIYHLSGDGRKGKMFGLSFE